MNSKKITLIILFNLLIISNLTSQTPFKDIAKEAGIDHQFVVFEGMFGGGACAFDYDNDGFEDLYITSGMNTDGLYKNNKNGTFTNVFEGSGLELTKKYVTQGVVSADVNKDGFRDLFITTITTKGDKKPIPRAINLLFVNLGNGKFRDATKEYKMDQMNSFSTSASFGDFNADGWPDLYIGNYFNEFKGELSVINDATLVGANQISKGYLLLNKEGKYFEDAYESYDLTHKGFGFGGIFTDFDNDGDQDLYVIHDFGYKRTPNLLLENKYPRETFSDISEKMKMDLKINAMGAAVGDYNNDGWLDYFVTNIRSNKFMVNKGDGKPFEEMSNQLGTGLTAISWGANFADFDQDGDQDLYVCNGDLNPNCNPMANYYFENNKGKFTEMARANGINDYGIGRGSVVFDMENDGDLDILVVNEKPVYPNFPVSSVTKLFRNDSTKGNWLKVKLVGKIADNQGIGARVEVHCADLKMIREIDGGASSHLSQNSTIAHFGLGKMSKIDKIIITWVGGKQQVLENQKINTLIVIHESEEDNKSFWNFYLLGGMAITLIILYLIARNLKRK
ncbi:MAG: CRTAC1 family protein [Bacteroidota bacterium]